MRKSQERNRNGQNRHKKKITKYMTIYNKESQERNRNRRHKKKILNIQLYKKISRGKQKSQERNRNTHHKKISI